MAAETRRAEIAGETVTIRKRARTLAKHASADPDDGHPVIYTLTIGDTPAGAP